MEKKQKTQKVQRIWQELSRDENDVVKVLNVIDFGLTRLARTRPRMRQTDKQTDKRTWRLYD